MFLKKNNIIRRSVLNSLLVFTFGLSIITVLYHIQSKTVTAHTAFNKNILPDYSIIKKVTKCNNIELLKGIKQHGNFFVIYNFVRALNNFDCEKSITLTTHGDFRYLGNLLPLLKRWRGPISISIYCPGSDFILAVESITYLRCCAGPLIKQFVTFHLFFEPLHIPPTLRDPLYEAFNENCNCNTTAPYLNYDIKNVYKYRKKLLYPINVARNIARELAQTYFIFPLDMDLHPSPNFINKFLTMVSKKPGLIETYKRNIFVLPVFQIKNKLTIPETKTELTRMVKKSQADIFHINDCLTCHLIPNYQEWLAANETTGLDIFHTAKRYGWFVYWEPYFVTTKNSPFFDERFTWEGRSNKISQSFALCLYNYNFVILNNAFLIHRSAKINQQTNRYFKLVKDGYNRARLAEKEWKMLLGNNKKCLPPPFPSQTSLKKGIPIKETKKLKPKLTTK